MISKENIGEWTTGKLTRFIQQMLQEEIRKGIASFDELTVANKLTVSDEVWFRQGQGTVGAAGGASALPATPAGYLKVLDPAGLVKLIPYYNI